MAYFNSCREIRVVTGLVGNTNSQLCRMAYGAYGIPRVLSAKKDILSVAKDKRPCKLAIDRLKLVVAPFLSVCLFELFAVYCTA